MNVQVEFLGMPSFTRQLGGKKIDLDLPGSTVADLLDHVVDRFGRPAREALLDTNGELDLTVQILLNERTWVGRDEHDTRIEEGDKIALIMLVAGG